MYFEPSNLSNISISLRNNTLDAVQYITDISKRIDQIEKELHCLVPEKGRKKRLLAQMHQLLETYPNPSSRPSLFGVLTGVDDMLRVDGLPTTAGSELPPKALAGEQSAAVTLLQEAGAIVLGKTECSEFGYLNPAKTTNPHDTDYSPGGASGGAAAAVAAGFCPLALGIQTTASVIRSAAYCGIVGFKPSAGRIPASGVIPFAKSVDQLGFFTQDINGSSLAASVLVHNWDPEVRIVSKPRICLPSDAFLVQARCDVYNRFYKKIDTLADYGFEVSSFPFLKEIREVNKVHREIIAAEFAQAHKKWYSEYGEFYSSHSRGLFEQGSKIGKSVLAVDKAIQQAQKDSIREVMLREGIDLWICPSTVTSAPKGHDSTGSPLMSLPWTLAGLPTITIPAGKSSHNMPLGIQLIAGPGRDERLLQYAGELFQLLSY
jgi:Asp-tRNA(Asn)/Glu-tRNA(Gln) amidotransferase A subunit family amidase